MKTKFIALIFCLALGISQAANAQLFVSFFDVDNAAAGNITTLTPFSTDSKCFNAAMSLVEDGLTDVFDMTVEESTAALTEAGIGPGLYKFRFTDGATKKTKKLTFSGAKAGLDRDNNKGKNKTVFAFRVKKNKKTGELTISKRNTKIACATDDTITAGDAVSVSFSSSSGKAVREFGLLSTIFSLTVE